MNRFIRAIASVCVAGICAHGQSAWNMTSPDSPPPPVVLQSTILDVVASGVGSPGADYNVQARCANTAPGTNVSEVDDGEFNGGYPQDPVGEDVKISPFSTGNTTHKLGYIPVYWYESVEGGTYWAVDSATIEVQ